VVRGGQAEAAGIPPLRAGGCGQGDPHADGPQGDRQADRAGAHLNNTGKIVRDQYESYPYPARDPGDEAKRLVTGSPSHIAEIDHYIFAGARDWARPFRALFAGGGTGDGCIMLAQQLAERGTPAEIVHLDLSLASQGVAAARARARGLTNIRFVNGSLLDLGRLAPGLYDYIDCCGVLHHLVRPEDGLAVLAQHLSPQGGMGMMLYAPLGRTGVYPLQEALRALGGNRPLAARVEDAKALLRALPATNWFARNPHLGDHVGKTDAELVDLLLHGQDRAFTVPEIFALCDGANLAPVGFLPPLRYDPAPLLTDPGLRERALALPWEQRLALAENLSGSLKVHVFYAVPRAAQGGTVAQPGPDMAVVPHMATTQQIARFVDRATVTLDLDGHKVSLNAPPGAAAIARRFDGQARGVLENDAALGTWALLHALNFALLRRV
jgi:SAM-dependent methyltransferase